MKQRIFCLFFTIVFSFAACAGIFRPPSVPLVTCDPYFSIWSPGNKLTDVETAHWTGKARRLASLVRIDGQSYRLMGTEPGNVPALAQTDLQVLPTRTIYTFAGQGVEVTLMFMTPMLPEDLDILSRPVTYLTWTAKATDGQAHAVAVYFDARGTIASESPDEALNFEPANASGIKAWRVGTVEQPVLQKKGDDVRIDWGYFYEAIPAHAKGGLTVNAADATRNSFMTSGKLPGAAATSVLQNNRRDNLVMAYAADLGKVSGKPATCWLMLAYDDLYSIQYMKHNLRPYWRRNGWEAADLLRASAKDYASLQQRCAAFDAELTGDLRRVGGEDYALIGSLAYRQCFAAGKFVADDHGQPLQFCKENHSNGCISTSDVFYPMSPQFLLFGPTLAKSFIVPFMNYAASARWKFPFAPHDLGTYPQANGQVYGGGERGEENQMPVEESGNLLILFGAVAEMEGNAEFAGLYWKTLEQWAEYLKAKGFDPENQLCTDDFAGHLAHNVNLSVKAICGLGSFAMLCEMRGETAKAKEYSDLAKAFAQRWMKEADDGDHYRLAFDRPGTWSQKYNLMWDRILGLNLFPASVAEKEMAFYLKKQNQFGLPLDNRKDYTKLDWITWTATLTQKREDFETLIKPIVKFLDETPDRTPMTDWYETKTGRRVGFDARPVVGGVFAQMLYEKPIWAKYARRDETKASGWAAMPQPPKLTVVIPAADQAPAVWQYTTSRPAGNWMKPGFDAANWQEGKSGFGTSQTPGAIVGTPWHTGDIWLRREIEMPAGNYPGLRAWLHYDEDAEVYVNGVLALKAGGYVDEYDAFPLTPAGRAALHPGKNLIALHCHQTTGGQYIDLGFVQVQPPSARN
jgi:hypothetical protein